MASSSSLKALTARSSSASLTSSIDKEGVLKSTFFLLLFFRECVNLVEASNAFFLRDPIFVLLSSSSELSKSDLLSFLSSKLKDPSEHSASEGHYTIQKAGESQYHIFHLQDEADTYLSFSHKSYQRNLFRRPRAPKDNGCISPILYCQSKKLEEKQKKKNCKFKENKKIKNKNLLSMKASITEEIVIKRKSMYQNVNFFALFSFEPKQNQNPRFSNRSTSI